MPNENNPTSSNIVSHAVAPEMNAVRVAASIEVEINELHQAAQADAQSAVEHAIRCGQLLIKQKDKLHHGEFRAWVAAHLTFSQATASRYMKAARAQISHHEHFALGLRALQPEPPLPALGATAEQEKPQRKKAASTANPAAADPPSNIISFHEARIRREPDFESSEAIRLALSAVWQAMFVLADAYGLDPNDDAVRASIFDWTDVIEEEFMARSNGTYEPEDAA